MIIRVAARNFLNVYCLRRLENTSSWCLTERKASGVTILNILLMRQNRAEANL